MKLRPILPQRANGCAGRLETQRPDHMSYNRREADKEGLEGKSGKFGVEGVGSAQTAGKGISTCMREHWGHEHLLGTQKLPIPGEVPMY